jgi:hypothetical protein
MLEASSKAGKMPLHLASFHAATWDYTLYSEGFLAPFASNGGLHDPISSFISIDELIRHPVLDPDYVSVEDLVAWNSSGKKIAGEKITPDKLASILSKDGGDVLKIVKSLRPASGALACELDDLETWGYLSLYFADKLSAAISLHTYRQSGNAAEKKKAVKLLSRCLTSWEKLSDITARHYREVPYIDELGYGQAYRDAQTFVWRKYLPQVARDIDIARQAVPD